MCLNDLRLLSPWEQRIPLAARARNLFPSLRAKIRILDDIRRIKLKINKTKNMSTANFTRDPRRYLHHVRPPTRRRVVFPSRSCTPIYLHVNFRRSASIGQIELPNEITYTRCTTARFRGRWSIQSVACDFVVARWPRSCERELRISG